MDENEKEYSRNQEAIGEAATGSERFALLIREIHDALHEGESPEEIAEAAWPHLKAIVTESTNAAAELGRKGGRKGGRARAKKLSAEERSEIARKAAEARWKQARESEEA